jgi:hypothetical protein
MIEQATLPMEAPLPPPPDGTTCKRCGSGTFRTSWQTHGNGTQHVRCECALCGGFVKWLKQDGAKRPPVQPATMPPPGVRCPCCRAAEMNLGADDRGRAVLSCAACQAFVRLLQRHGDEAPAVDFDDPAADVPPDGSWWLAYVKGGDGKLRPVALSESLPGAWDGAMYCHLRGTLIVAPTDPPRKVTHERVAVEDDGT